MKKLIVSIGIATVMIAGMTQGVSAQIANSVIQRNELIGKRPMPLPDVRPSDVFWAKTIWRIVDLREKMNLPLYYPTTETDGRMNLINVLLEGIEDGLITPFDARLDDNFEVPMSYEQVQEAFGAETTVEETIDFDTGERKTVVIPGEIRTNEVKQYMIKEEWYFNKQTSALNVRILGICPIREYTRDDDPSGQVLRQKVFWVAYPEVRSLLATKPVVNPNNEAQAMSYDDLFIKRYFNSYIVQGSAAYDDSEINAFTTGKEAMLESQRIENEILNFEQDLWEY